MFAVLIKLLVPLLGFYFVQKWVRNAIKLTFNPPNEQSGSQQPSHRGGAENVIEICPECGNVEEKGHKCY